MPWAVAAAVVGGVVASNTAGKAAKAQSSASMQSSALQGQYADESLNLQRDIFNQQVELNKPWQDEGLQALKQYASNPSFSFNYNDLTADPSYKFRQKEGINALDMSAAARGKLLSGAQDKALTQYGQNLASEEYSNAYNRALQNYNTDQNRQLNLANIGRGAAGQTQNAMAQYGQGASNILQNTGNAMAQNAMNQGNVMSNLYNTQGQIINQGIGNALYSYQSNKKT